MSKYSSTHLCLCQDLTKRIKEQIDYQSIHHLLFWTRGHCQRIFTSLFFLSTLTSAPEADISDFLLKFCFGIWRHSQWEFLITRFADAPIPPDLQIAENWIKLHAGPGGKLTLPDWRARLLKVKIGSISQIWSDPLNWTFKQVLQKYVWRRDLTLWQTRQWKYFLNQHN